MRTQTLSYTFLCAIKVVTSFAQFESESAMFKLYYIYIYVYYSDVPKSRSMVLRVFTFDVTLSPLWFWFGSVWFGLLGPGPRPHHPA